MLEKIIYRNHSGEEIRSAEGGIYVNENDLRDHEWSHLESSGKIVEFYRGIVKKTIPLIVIADSDAEGVRIKNELLSIAEKDVISVKPGKIIIGGFYMTGYITESKKSKYLYSNQYTEYNLKFVSDNPFWITESTKSFTTAGSTKSGYEFLDYPYDYDYDYAPDFYPPEVINIDHYADCKFLLKIYGPAIEPAVTINGIERKVYVTLEEGQYLLIDARDKTVKRILIDGTALDAFDNRKKAGKSIFTPMIPGLNQITWNHSFRFDLTIFKERSEPEWR